MSVSSNLATLRSKARALRLGRWIARLEIQEQGPIRFEKTLLDPDHYTLWGEPEALLGCVGYPLESVRIL